MVDVAFKKVRPVDAGKACRHVKSHNGKDDRTLYNTANESEEARRRERRLDEIMRA